MGSGAPLVDLKTTAPAAPAPATGENGFLLLARLSFQVAQLELSAPLSGPASAASAAAGDSKALAVGVYTPDTAPPIMPNPARSATSSLLFLSLPPEIQ